MTCMNIGFLCSWISSFMHVSLVSHWNLIMRVLSSSLKRLILARVTGPTRTWILSSLASFNAFLLFPSSQEEFTFKLSPASKRERLETLNEALTEFSPGKSNLLALSLMRARTWNGPSPWGSSFEHLCSGNRSLRMCPYLITWFEYYLTTSLVGLFCILLHSLSILSLAVSCIYWISLTFF